MVEDKIIIKNIKTLVSCDEENRIYSNVDILIKGNEIKKMGRVWLIQMLK